MDNMQKFCELFDLYELEHQENRTEPRNEELEQLKEEAKRLEEMLKGLCEENAKLKSEISIKMDELEFAVRCDEDQETGNAQTTEGLQELMKDVTENEESQIVLENDVAEIHTESAEPKEEFQNDQKEEIKTTPIECNKLNMEMAATETELKQQLATLTTNTELKSNELLVKQQKCLEITEKCGSLSIRFNKDKVDITAIDSTRNRIVQLIKNALIELDKQLVYKMSVVNKLNAEITDLSSVNSELELKVKGMKDKMNKTIEQRDALVAENKQLAEEIDRHTENLQGLQKLQDDSVVENEVLLKTIGYLQNKAEDSESKIEGVNNKILEALSCGFAAFTDSSPFPENVFVIENLVPYVNTSPSSIVGQPKDPSQFKRKASNDDAVDDTEGTDKPDESSEQKPSDPKRSKFSVDCEEEFRAELKDADNDCKKS